MAIDLFPRQRRRRRRRLLSGDDSSVLPLDTAALEIVPSLRSLSCVGLRSSAPSPSLPASPSTLSSRRNSSDMRSRSSRSARAALRRSRSHASSSRSPDSLQPSERREPASSASYCSESPLPSPPSCASSRYTSSSSSPPEARGHSPTSRRPRSPPPPPPPSAEPATSPSSSPSSRGRVSLARSSPPTFTLSRSALARCWGRRALSPSSSWGHWRSSQRRRRFFCCVDAWIRPSPRARRPSHVCPHALVRAGIPARLCRLSRVPSPCVRACVCLRACVRVCHCRPSWSSNFLIAVLAAVCVLLVASRPLRRADRTASRDARAERTERRGSKHAACFASLINAVSRLTTVLISMVVLFPLC